jgi:hypothetical protein
MKRFLLVTLAAFAVCNLLSAQNQPLASAPATETKREVKPTTVEIGPEVATIEQSNDSAKIWWPQRFLSVPSFSSPQLEIEQGRVRVLTFNKNVLEVIHVDSGIGPIVQTMPLDEKRVIVLGREPGRSTLQVITEQSPGDKSGFATTFNCAVRKPLPPTGRAGDISEIALNTETGLVVKAVHTSLILRADGSAISIQKVLEPRSDKWQVITQNGTFAVEDFGRLADYFRLQGFFHMKKSYPAPATDCGRTSLSVIENGVQTKVESSCGSGPFELWSIEKAMGQIAATVKWSDKKVLSEEPIKEAGG